MSHGDCPLSSGTYIEPDPANSRHSTSLSRSMTIGELENLFPRYTCLGLVCQMTCISQLFGLRSSSNAVNFRIEMRLRHNLLMQKLASFVNVVAIASQCLSLRLTAYRE